jgi:hypothetical protein
MELQNRLEDDLDEDRIVGPSDRRPRRFGSSGRNHASWHWQLPFFCEHVFFFRLTKRAAVLRAAANNPNPRGHPLAGIVRSWPCGWQASASSKRSGAFNSLKRASG